MKHFELCQIMQPKLHSTEIRTCVRVDCGLSEIPFSPEKNYFQAIFLMNLVLNSMAHQQQLLQHLDLLNSQFLVGYRTTLATPFGKQQTVEQMIAMILLRQCF